MLGVHFSPAGNLSTHVEHMVQKGFDWVDCLCTKPMARHDAWLSFYLQLFPGMLRGLVTICMPPKQFDAKIQGVYAQALLYLGVNRNIKWEWRTLPETYHGLGMPNMPLLSLSEKISLLLGNWGFLGQAHSNTVSMAYKKFLIEVGLYGTPLKNNYNKYSHLAMEATWFQNLWSLVSVYEVDITYWTDDMVQGIREGDRLLISEFFQLGYHGKQLAALNVVRCFCNLLHGLDITRCDRLSLT
jgi:hypothetical protein